MCFHILWQYVDTWMSPGMLPPEGNTELPTFPLLQFSIITTQGLFKLLTWPKALTPPIITTRREWMTYNLCCIIIHSNSYLQFLKDSNIKKHICDAATSGVSDYSQVPICNWERKYDVMMPTRFQKIPFCLFSWWT